MLRTPILLAARSDRLRTVVERAPVSRRVVRRFVAGSDDDAAVQATRELAASGLLTSLDHLGEDTLDAGAADATVRAYEVLLGRLADEGLSASAEVSVKLTAVGLDIDRELGLDGARRIASAARNAGTTITVDMEDHTRTDATLEAVGLLRQDFPDVRAVVQAMLRRTEADCRDLAVAGSRVRLCKGAYSEPASVAFAARAEVSASYARCLGILMAGPGHPMVASHDPEMIALAGRLADGRDGTHEYQMLFGIRPLEQQRLARAGETVRIYTPYGAQWYGYLMRRMAERPANLTFFLRSLATRS